MASPTDGHNYYILSSGGALTLDLAGGSSSNGTPVLGWSPHFDQVSKNRVWTLHNAGLGAWNITNLQGGTSLTLADDNDGTPVTCSQGNDPTQQWYLEYPQSQPTAQVISFV